MKTETIIIEVAYDISYDKDHRDEAIKAAEKVPLGIVGAGYKAIMKHADLRYGEPRGKMKPNNS